ncbi:MAG: hypothetical protein KJ971_07595 [Firmicutes bacterium]|nr:hypothetical protein [Bacillota bacterium]
MSKDEKSATVVTHRIGVSDSFATNNPKTVETLSKHHLIYSIAGLMVGLLCVIGGIVLFLNGVAGSTSWTAKFIGVESDISDAAPGAVLFIVGLFIVFLTRYIFKINSK